MPLSLVSTRTPPPAEGRMETWSEESTEVHLDYSLSQLQSFSETASSKVGLQFYHLLVHGMQAYTGTYICMHIGVHTHTHTLQYVYSRVKVSFVYITVKNG